MTNEKSPPQQEEGSPWNALKHWGEDVERIEALSGGVANDVWSVRVAGEIAVARLGKRTDADLTWETELLQYLNSKGMHVPVPIPTTDGCLFSGGIVVMTYIEGRAPESKADWRLVAATLRLLHHLTKDWSQRPGWSSSIDLLETDKGTKVDLAAMPAEGVARCRAAWARLSGREMSVIHGDPNDRNILIDSNRVALIDWDEAHLDVPDLDLALPHNAADLGETEFDRAMQAYAAWEAAVCWDDDYSKNRLAEVRALT